MFSVEGVLLASVVAGLPLVVKPIETAIAGVSRSLGEASRTLGRNEWDTFVYVILPNIRDALIAGLVLGTARSLGEVGITLMLGGNIVGKTNTMPLEIYHAVFNGEYPRAGVRGARHRLDRDLPGAAAHVAAAAGLTRFAFPAAAQFVENM